MTRLYHLILRLWREIQYNNRTAAAYHRQRNHSNNPPAPRRGAPKGHQK